MRVGREDRERGGKPEQDNEVWCSGEGERGEKSGVRETGYSGDEREGEKGKGR